LQRPTKCADQEFFTDTQIAELDRQRDLTKQDEGANRIYYEPRCVEGNYWLLGMLANSRAEEHTLPKGAGRIRRHATSRQAAQGEGRQIKVHSPAVSS
jgi:hypothetical protein